MMHDRIEKLNLRWKRIKKRAVTKEHKKLYNWASKNFVRVDEGTEAFDYWLGHEVAMLQFLEHMFRMMKKVSVDK